MPDEHGRVYVLRLWDETGSPHGQRISLYDEASNERLYFASLAALLAHLSDQLGPDSKLPETPHSRFQEDV